MSLVISNEVAYYFSEILGDEIKTITVLKKLSTYYKNSFKVKFSEDKIIEFHNGEDSIFNTDILSIEDNKALKEVIEDYMSYSYSRMDEGDGWLEFMPTIILPGLSEEWEMDKIKTDTDLSLLYAENKWFQMETYSKLIKSITDKPTVQYLDKLVTKYNFLAKFG